MSYASTTDPKFLGKLECWFPSQPETLLLIRYSHAAGSKDFEFFSSFQDVATRIRELPQMTCITAFKQPQLPLRGVVDYGFIDDCMRNIPDGSEYLVLEMTRRVYGPASWFHHAAGESHVELREELQESFGVVVAVRLYPLWLEETDDVISAVVPDEHGIVKPGVY